MEFDRGKVLGALSNPMILSVFFLGANLGMWSCWSKTRLCEAPPFRLNLIDRSAGVIVLTRSESELLALVMGALIGSRGR